MGVEVTASVQSLPQKEFVLYYTDFKGFVMVETTVELDFSRAAPPVCKHCRRPKGSHKAGTFHCPIGRGGFPSFSVTQVYEARKTRAKKQAAD